MRRRETPGPGQESVWDYPRPPRVEPSTRRVRVVLGEVTLWDTTAALRVLETSHPPTWYLPLDALAPEVGVTSSPRTTVCEFKGRARYLTFAVDGRTAGDAAWAYPEPRAGFEALAGHAAVYPSKVDGCWVDDERVRAQEGDFYGGWVTADVVGPFKGGPGTWGW